MCKKIIIDLSVIFIDRVERTYLATIFSSAPESWTQEQLDFFVFAHDLPILLIILWDCPDHHLLFWHRLIFRSMQRMHVLHLRLLRFPGKPIVVVLPASSGAVVDVGGADGAPVVSGETASTTLHHWCLCLVELDLSLHIVDLIAEALWPL